MVRNIFVYLWQNVTTMRTKFIEIRFSKTFFARLLNVQPSDIQYIMIKAETLCGPHFYPGLSVKGISQFYYDLYYGEFSRVTDNMEILRATVRRRGPYIVFTDARYPEASPVPAEASMDYADFYRTYLTKTANTLLAD